MSHHTTLRRSLLTTTLAAALGAGLGAVALPGVAAATIADCRDVFEASTDVADLSPGVATERGFCEPDGSFGGADTDWLRFPTDSGHRYRIELVERGPGFDGADFAVDESYDANTQSPQFTPEGPYVKTTSPLPGGSLLFSVTGVATDGSPRTGADMGYRVLVTDLGSAGSEEVAEPAVSSVSLTSSTVRAGSSTTVVAILDRPAPAGGAVVTMRSSDARVSLPASISVAPGQDRVSVSAVTSRTKARYTATITASTAAGSAAAVLQVLR